MARKPFAACPDISNRTWCSMDVRKLLVMDELEATRR